LGGLPRGAGGGAHCYVGHDLAPAVLASTTEFQGTKQLSKRNARPRQAGRKVLADAGSTVRLDACQGVTQESAYIWPEECSYFNCWHQQGTAHSAGSGDDVLLQCMLHALIAAFIKY
jgi:hypothetical protein